MKTPKTIGERLELALKHRGIKQNALAKYLNVTSGAINHWLKGRCAINHDQCVKLCGFISISVTWLLEGIGEMDMPATVKNEYERKIIKLIRGKNKDIQQAFLTILSEK